MKIIFTFIYNGFRRLKNILPLFVVATLLFYYSFQNELNRLNTFAENELLPHITTEINVGSAEPLLSSKVQLLGKLPTDSQLGEDVKYQDQQKLPTTNNGKEIIRGDEESTKKILEDKISWLEANMQKSSDETVSLQSKHIDLSEINVLLEKNRYYPLLHKDFYTSLFDYETIKEYSSPDLLQDTDLSDVLTNLHTLHKKSHYLLVENAGIKKSFHYINSKYPSIQSTKFTDRGIAEDKLLNDIKAIFTSTYTLYSHYAFGADEMHPLAKTPDNKLRAFGKSLLGSLDMLYLLEMKPEVLKIVEHLTESHLASDKLLLSTHVIFQSIVSSLISAYELSHEQDKILLEKAKLMAELGIKGYDTPNSLPMIEFPWKSMLSNRFPLKNSKFSELVGSTLELTKLSILLKDNIYYSTAHSVLENIEHSKEKFHIDYLFPKQVDASGCTILSESEVTEGGHLGDSVMKSIFDGEFIFCKQANNLMPLNYEDDQVYEFNDKEDSTNYYFELLKVYHLLNGHEDNLHLVKSFVNAIEQIFKFMLFQPKLPTSDSSNDLYANIANSDILLISSVESAFNYDPITNSKKVHVKQTLKMDHSNCQAGAMFMFAAKLLQNDTYADVGKKLIHGCVQLPQYFKSGLMPESLVAEKCETGESCKYDPKKKMQKLLNNEYFVEEDFAFGINGFSGIKVNDADGFNSQSNQLDKDDLAVAIESSGVNKIEKARVEDTSNKNKKRSASLADPIYQSTTNEYFISVIPPSCFESRKFSASQENTWLDAPNLPFFLNDIEAEYLLKPDIIESLFYAYRTTGDSKYRTYAKKQYASMIKAVVQLHGKGRTEISSLKDIFTLETLDKLPHYWFSKTLKYYYLIFSEPTVLSLDDYVFNNDGHPFLKTAIFNENVLNDYVVDWDKIFD